MTSIDVYQLEATCTDLWCCIWNCNKLCKSI